MAHREFLESFKQCIPALTNQLHKGSNGKIGVIGGSFEYTGAPYFAAISALKVGADLVHVFCTAAAGSVIKSYSPELIVHPLLDAPDAVCKISPWLSRLNALVVGPGLGRDKDIHETVAQILLTAPNIPLVLDADGIWLPSSHPIIFTNPSRPLIVTPNIAEVERLPTHLKAVLLKKGYYDLVFNSKTGDMTPVEEDGSPRRCGGQGDVLSGILGTFLAWYCQSAPEIPDYSVPAVAASVLTKKISKAAFEKYKRSMVAGNLIENIGETFEDVFES